MTTRLTQLYYSVRVVSGHNIAATASSQVVLGDFHCELKRDLLVARPRIDFTDHEPARAALEPFLEGWSAKAEIIDGMRIEFRFAGGMAAEIDSNGVATPVHLTSMGLGPLGYPESEYALPDARWREESSLGLNLRTRWREHADDQYITLPILGRRMLDAIEHEYGGAESAAVQLDLSLELMDELHRLLGGGVRAPIANEALHGKEREWLRVVLDALVRRVHEVDAGVEGLPPLGRERFKFARVKHSDELL